MSIDALVFCDCLERGAVRRPPKPEWRVYVQDDGCRECASQDHGAQAAFGLWHETACHHDYGILLHRTLASGEGVRRLAELIGEYGCTCPVLQSRILAARPDQDDFLDAAAVESLLSELKTLRKSVGVLPPAVEPVVVSLEELAACAGKIRKPLVL